MLSKVYRLFLAATKIGLHRDGNLSTADTAYNSFQQIAHDSLGPLNWQAIGSALLGKCQNIAVHQYNAHNLKVGPVTLQNCSVRSGNAR